MTTESNVRNALQVILSESGNARSRLVILGVNDDLLAESLTAIDKGVERIVAELKNVKIDTADALSTGPKCDYRMGTGEGQTCPKPIAYECFCGRCIKENSDGTFHSCAEHRNETAVAHSRVYPGRTVDWGQSRGKPR